MKKQPYCLWAVRLLRYLVARVQVAFQAVLAPKGHAAAARAHCTASNRSALRCRLCRRLSAVPSRRPASPQDSAGEAKPEVRRTYGFRTAKVGFVTWIRAGSDHDICCAPDGSE